MVVDYSKARYAVLFTIHHHEIYVPRDRGFKITYTVGLLLVSIHIALKYLVAKISRKRGGVVCFEIKKK